MTNKERLKQDYPKYLTNSDDGVTPSVYCPSHFGYPEHPDCKQDGNDLETCIKCWELEPESWVIARPKILDSGARMSFKSGAVRDIRDGKGRCDLLPLDVIAAWTRNSIFSDLCYFQQDSGNVGYLLDVLDEFVRQQYNNIPNALLEVAIHFEEGCNKYGENNWQKGIPVHCYVDSAVRHYLKYLRGDKDEPHDRAFLWNILCAYWTCKNMPEMNTYREVE